MHFKLNVFLLKKFSGMLNEQIWFLLGQRLTKEGPKNTIANNLILFKIFGQLKSPENISTH